MKLSTRARYGLRLCFLMGLSGELTSLSLLVRQTGLSEKYLEQLLGMLKRGDIVEAKRGANGGYNLTRQPSEISLDQILTALNDNFDLTDCAQGKCEDNYCPNRSLFVKLHSDIKNVLKSTSLKDIINDSFCKEKEEYERNLS